MPTKRKSRTRTAPRRRPAPRPPIRRSRSRLSPGAVPSSDDEAPRSRPNDLELELYRQRSLLSILAARLRESASSLERARAIDPDRMRRAIDVHRRFLVEVHHANETAIANALSGVRAARPVVAQCLREHARATGFETDALPLLSAGPSAVPQLVRLVRGEADRIERQQAWEEEHLHARLGAWLAPAEARRLLAWMRRFDAARIDAEIALISWASQLHPSAD